MTVLRCLLASWIVVAAAVAAEPNRGAVTKPPVARQPALEVSSMLVKLIEQVEVPARETGVLAAVEVSEGQMVEEGQLLARIEDTEARTAAGRVKIEVEVARVNAENEINVRFARKSVEVAKAELRRSLDSNARYAKSISESELDRLKLLVEKGDLEIEQAQHEFRIAGFNRQIKENEMQAAQQRLERHRLMAPLSGVIVQVSRHRGEWVKPGDSVVHILRLDRVRAEGFLKAEQLAPDLQGRPVTLRVDLPGQPGQEFRGKIVFVDPQIDPVNAQVRVWAEVENRQLRLRPGMRAAMTMAPGQPPKVPQKTP